MNNNMNGTGTTAPKEVTLVERISTGEVTNITYSGGYAIRNVMEVFNIKPSNLFGAVEDITLGRARDLKKNLAPKEFGFAPTKIVEEFESLGDQVVIVEGKIVYDNSNKSARRADAREMEVRLEIVL